MTVPVAHIIRAAWRDLMDAITAFLAGAITSPFMPLIVLGVCLIDGFFPPVPSETTVVAAVAVALASDADQGAIPKMRPPPRTTDSASADARTRQGVDRLTDWRPHVL